MPDKFKAPPGMNDVLPADSHKWQYVESVLRDVARQFGHSEIRFPMFEYRALFDRGVGETTDVVQKEMFDLKGEHEGRTMTLRPEGTASVMRSLIEHSLDKQGLPLKLFYIAPNFRHERPQKGRYWQHYQFGIELFGVASPSADAEVISFAHTYLSRLGAPDLPAHLNSIGCPDCRPPYLAKLREYLRSHRDTLCPTCHGRMERNPLRVLDCKNHSCSVVATDAPKSLDNLCADCAAHFDTLKRELDVFGIPYVEDTRIVRGLDYYTRTVFEFISDKIGAQATVCAGGRYDKLSETLGGDPLPGLGFGSGIERLLLHMEAVGSPIPDPSAPDIFIASTDEASRSFAARLVYELRALGLSAEQELMGRSLKAQLRYADKTRARFSAVIGGDEIKNALVTLKDMATGQTRPCALSAEDILAVVRG